MLGRVKQLFSTNDGQKESADLLQQLTQLEPGSDITFSASPLHEIAGRKFRVKSMHTYWFDNQPTESFALQSDSMHLFMTVANEGEGSYIGISKQLAPEAMEAFFDAEALEFFLLPSTAQHLRMKPDAKPNDWIARQYSKVMDDYAGQRFDGRYPGQARPSEPLHYTLLVTDSNEHAIEIERYVDGTLRILATVYRPLTDIAHITVPLQANGPVFIDDTSSQSIAPEPVSTPTSEDDKVTPLYPENTAPLATEPVEEPAYGAVTLEDLLDESDSNHIACRMDIAADLINDAIDQNMRIADVIRQRIGLPVALQEVVSFTMNLTEEDYKTLAMRYGVKATNREAIRERMLLELHNSLDEGE